MDEQPPIENPVTKTRARSTAAIDDTDAIISCSNAKSSLMPVTN
jgi:hypothetical protein